jgi:ribonuclease H2 subunit A
MGKSLADLKTITTDYEKDSIILGIDEAGRGPVLGAMVYACCYWAEQNEERILKALKFADSKTLKEEVRENLFDQMQQIPNALG